MEDFLKTDPEIVLFARCMQCEGPSTSQLCFGCRRQERLEARLDVTQETLSDLYRILQRIESRVLEMREDMRARESGVRIQRPMAGGR